MLTGGKGNDRFVFNNLRDAGDIINDFTPYADKLDLSALLASVGCKVAEGCQPVADGYIKLVDVTGGASVLIDSDGSGPQVARPLVTLKGLSARQVVPARDFAM